MPLLPAIGFFHAIMLGLSPLLISGRWAEDDLLVRVPRFGVEPALVLFAGLALMLGCAWLGRTYLFSRLKTPLGQREHSNGTARLLLWGLLAIHMAFYALPWANTVPSLSPFVRSAGTAAFAGLLLMGWRGQIPRWEFGAVLLVILPVRLVLGYLTSAVGESIYLCGALLFVLFHLRPRMIFGLVAVVCTLAVLSYKPVHIYRSAVVDQGYLNGSISEKLGVLAAVIVDPSHYGHDVNKSDWDIGRRLAHAEVMNTVMAATPEQVPYWNGKTYKLLLSNLVPRLLWPDKPLENQGNEFGRRYGFVKADNLTTSMNLPWLVEAFVNFGIPGVLGISAAIGLLIGLVEALFNRPGAPWQLAVSAIMLLPFINQDSNLSLSIGNLLTIFVALMIYFRGGFHVGDFARRRMGWTTGER